MIRKARSIRVGLMALAGFLAIPDGLRAEEAWPSRDVRMVVAFAPGGPVDIIARILGAELGKRWKHSVIVENRGGAGGNIAAVAVAKSEPDGSVVLATSSAFAVNLTLSRQPGYLPEDFAIAAVVATTPNLLVAAPNLKATTLQEVIAAAKTEKFTYGTAGIGTTPHLSAERIFRMLANVDIVHAPFTGAGPALNSVMGGHTPLASVALPAAMEIVKAKQVKPLAVTSRERVAVLPDVPTTRELGFGDEEDATWVAFFVPAATPPAITAKLNADVNAALAEPEVVEKLNRLGFSVVGGTPEEARTQVHSEIKKWGGIIHKIGLDKSN